MSDTTANPTESGFQFHDSWKNHSRIRLIGMGVPKQSSLAVEEAINFRRGILFYFKELTLTTNVIGLIQKTNVDSVLKNAKELGTISNDARKIATEIIKGLRDGDAWLSQASESALADISGTIEKGASEIFSAIASVLSSVIAIGTKLYSGFSSLVILSKTSDLTSAIKSGSPTEIVTSMRKQISDDMKKKFAGAISNLAESIASACTGGLALTVVKGIKKVIETIWLKYKTAKDYYALKILKAECETKFKDPTSTINQKEFSDWLAVRMGELPIMACHCICSPLTGSYNNFINAVNQDGSKTKIDTNKLEAPKDAFESLKNPARKFINDYYHKFTTANPLVISSLKIAQDGGVDASKGAIAKNVPWYKRKLTNIGNKLGLTKSKYFV